MKPPRDSIFWNCIAGIYLSLEDICIFEASVDNHQIRRDLQLYIPHSSKRRQESQNNFLRLFSSFHFSPIDNYGNQNSEETDSTLLLSNQSSVHSSIPSNRSYCYENIHFNPDIVINLTSEDMVSWCERRRLRLLNVRLQYPNKRFTSLYCSVSDINQIQNPLFHNFQYISSILASVFCDCFLPGSNSYYRSDIRKLSNTNKQWDLLNHVKIVDIESLEGYLYLGSRLHSIESLSLHGQYETDLEQYYFHQLLQQIDTNIESKGIYIRVLRLHSKDFSFLSPVHLDLLIDSLNNIESFAFINPQSAVSDDHIIHISNRWRYVHSIELSHCSISSNSITNFGFLHRYNQNDRIVNNNEISQRQSYNLSSRSDIDSQNESNHIVSSFRSYRFQKLIFDHCENIRLSTISKILTQNPLSSSSLISLTCSMLSFSSIHNSNYELKQVLKLCPQLKQLTLHSVTSYDCLLTISSYCYKLIKLRLYSQSMITDSINNFYQGLISLEMSCRYIEALVLSLSIDINNGIWRVILNSYKDTLKELSIVYNKSCDVSELTIEEIKKAFQICRHRVELNIIPSD